MTAATQTMQSGALRRDFAALRNDFPALRQLVHGHPLAYLDSAASSQVPEPVLDALARQQGHDHANIHRAVHELGERSTAAYEGARAKVRRYINAAETAEIIFTRGTTESVNLVASSFGRQRLKPGDEVLITWLEHHSNIVPWQMVCEATGAELDVVPVQLICEQTGATLRVAPITDTGELDREAFSRLLSERTKLVAVAHVSNALGTVNPVAELIAEAHQVGAVVLVDGAQAMPHMRVDVRALDCDFYVFSGHKMFGPTGVGVLYGKRALLEAMPPYQGGGDMILTVRFDGTTYASLPYKFEAGTPNITGVVGLGAAIDYLQAIDFDAPSCPAFASSAPHRARQACSRS
jgi:cysteine desulfurase/selenocysteine lyase